MEYASESASDFDRLEREITKRLKVLLKKQVIITEIAAASPIKSTSGLQPREIAALVFVMSNAESSSSGAESHVIRHDMERAVYAKGATHLALLRLCQMGFVEPFEESDINGNRFITYRLLTPGEDWLLNNHGKLELKYSPGETEKRRFGEITGDDVGPHSSKVPMPLKRATVTTTVSASKRDEK